MKKKIVSLGLVLFMLLCANQVDAQIRFGVKGGMNVSSLKADRISEYVDSRIGFQVGPMMEVMVPIAGLGFDVAVMYSQRGSKIGEESYKTNLIEVPLNLKWKFGLPILKPFLAVGPYIGLRFGDDIIEQLDEKTFGAGLNFGAGVEVFKYVQVGANYMLGLTDDFSGAIAGHKFKGGKIRGWTINAAILF